MRRQNHKLTISDAIRKKKVKISGDLMEESVAQSEIADTLRMMP